MLFVSPTTLCNRTGFLYIDTRPASAGIDWLLSWQEQPGFANAFSPEFVNTLGSRVLQGAHQHCARRLPHPRRRHPRRGHPRTARPLPQRHRRRGARTGPAEVRRQPRLDRVATTPYIPPSTRAGRAAGPGGVRHRSAMIVFKRNGGEGHSRVASIAGHPASDSSARAASRRRPAATYSSVYAVVWPCGRLRGPEVPPRHTLHDRRA